MDESHRVEIRQGSGSRRGWCSGKTHAGSSDVDHCVMGGRRSDLYALPSTRGGFRDDFVLLGISYVVDGLVAVAPSIS